MWDAHSAAAKQFGALVDFNLAQVERKDENRRSAAELVAAGGVMAMQMQAPDLMANVDAGRLRLLIADAIMGTL